MTAALDDRELAARLRASFAEVADRTQPRRSHLDRAGSPPVHRSRRRPVLAVAAAVALVAGTAVLAPRIGGRSTVAVGEPPAASTGLFGPPPGTAVTERWMSEAGYGAAGALVAPGGRVFGLALHPQYADTPEEGELRMVGDREVRALADAEFPDLAYRIVHDDCRRLTVTTVGEDLWSLDALDVLAGVDLAGAEVTVAVPAGWDSLGAAPSGAQYALAFDAPAVGRVWLTQAPASPVATFLTMFERPPRRVQVGGGTAWAIDSDADPGSTTLVLSRDGTALRLSGRATADELAAVAASLVPAASTDWTESAAEMPPATMAPPPPGCVIPPLRLGP